MMTGRTAVYGIIGHPIHHSFSPSMQSAAFRAANIDAVYCAFDVHPDYVRQAIESLRALNIQGINVTIPHKTAILPFLDDISPIAQRIGAVNTIKNKEGRLIGTNTDGPGFLHSLNRLNFTIKQKVIAILGAGGAARAILVSLAEAHAATIWVINRTLKKAEDLIQEFSIIFPNVHMKATSLDLLPAEEIDLLINTTSVGLDDSQSPIDLQLFSQVHHVVDIIYNPAQTNFLKQAENLHIPWINGMDMLLYQGSQAFEFWLEQTAPIEIMRTQLYNDLNHQ